MNFNSPKTWREFRHLVESGGLTLLGEEYKRSAEVKQFYETERSQQTREQAMAALKQEIEQSERVYANGVVGSLTPNKFPYDLLTNRVPGVWHYLFWYEGELEAAQVLEALQSAGYDCCLYENPAHRLCCMIRKTVRFALRSSWFKLQLCSYRA